MAKTVARSLEYVKLYYPQLLKPEGLFKFQETLRANEAVNWDPDRSPRGWTAISAIRASNGVIPAEYASFMKEVLTALPEESKSSNVRRAVKDIWTWPMKGFLPWIPIRSAGAAAALDDASTILALIPPRLALVEGKIYLMMAGFTTRLWQCVPELGSFIPNLTHPLVPNHETEHITLVNSDMVHDQDAVREWLATQKLGQVAATGLQHTISLDWAPFSICIVIALKCDGLSEFIEAYNTKFGMKARVPSAHITVAIAPRNKPQ